MKYEDRIKTMLSPKEMNERPDVAIDFKDMGAYAESIGKTIQDLSQEEKERFVHPYKKRGESNAICERKCFKNNRTKAAGIS